MMLFIIFILSCFVGYEVIWRVTPKLHTPLMSLTNAISSIIIISALHANGETYLKTTSILSSLGIFLAAINIFGGFILTYRMLLMYRTRKKS